MEIGHGYESGGCAENQDSLKATVQRSYPGEQMSGGAIVLDSL